MNAFNGLPDMTPELRSFFTSLQNWESTNSRYKFPTLGNKINEIDQTINWLSTHQEWIRENPTPLSDKIFSVLAHEAPLFLDEARMCKIMGIYKQVHSAEKSSMNELVVECVKTDNSRSRNILFQFLQGATTQEIEDLLNNSPFLEELARSYNDDMRKSVFELLLSNHQESFHKALLSDGNRGEKSFLFILLNSYINDSNRALNLLINQPDMRLVICQFIQVNHASLSFHITDPLLERLIPDWPLDSLKEFLVQKKWSAPNLYRCLESETLEPLVLKRFPNLEQILKESDLINHCLSSTYNFSVLKKLLENNSDLTNHLSDVARFRILCEPYFDGLVTINRDECIQRLSDDQISELIANNTIEFRKILKNEDTLALLIERRNPQVMLKLLLTEPQHPFINQYSKYFEDIFRDPAHVKQLLAASVRDTLPPYNTYPMFNQNSFKALSRQHQDLLTHSLALALFPNSGITAQDLDLISHQLHIFLTSPNFIGIHNVLQEKVFLADYIASKSEWACLGLIPFAQAALKLGTSVTPSSLVWCIEMHNKELLKQYLNHVSPEMIQQQSGVLIKALAMCENMEVADLFYAKGLDVQAALPNLKSMIEANQFQVIKWLFSKGLKVTDPQLAEDLFESALQSNNIEIISLIAEHAGNLFDADYPASVLMQDKATPLVIRFLQKLAFHSPLPALYQFLEKNYPSLVPELNKMRPHLALLVRFPAKQERTEISQKWDNSLTYVKDSLKYAEENQAFLQEIVPELSHLSWSAFLKRVIQNRLERNPSLDSDYKLLRHHKSAVAITPLTSVCKEESDSTHIVPCRYFHAWNQGNLSRSLSNNPESVSTKPGVLQFNYILPSKEKVTITKLEVEMGSAYRGFRKLMWKHADPEVIVKCQERLEDLHKQVVQFKLTDSNQEEFYKLVAETYWLISTLVETGRGTPHNAMIWLNAVYRQHDLPPPIPKMEHFFLDNTMLVIPVEEAIAHWHTFFEDVPKRPLA